MLADLLDDAGAPRVVVLGTSRGGIIGKISGVSGGLATYLGIDPLLVRVGFVVTTLASGVGLLAYLALLALVPADDAQPVGDDAPRAGGLFDVHAAGFGVQARSPVRWQRSGVSTTSRRWSMNTP